jgi:hypothetical protein
MRTPHTSCSHEHAVEDADEALERLLDWSESICTCERLSASELLAKAEASGDALKRELAIRYAAALGR